MFDHLSLGVSDLARAVAFYDAVLAPLGHVRLGGNARSATYGPPRFTGEAPLGLIAFGDDATPPERGLHVAFAAPDRAARGRGSGGGGGGCQHFVVVGGAELVRGAVGEADPRGGAVRTRTRPRTGAPG